MSVGPGTLDPMSQIPDANYARPLDGDPRVEPSLTGDERATPTGFLDRHRHTFALKCSGVASAAMAERGVPPSRSLDATGVLARH
jgi:hypothetical protein